MSKDSDIEQAAVPANEIKVEPVAATPEEQLTSSGTTTATTATTVISVTNGGGEKAAAVAEKPPQQMTAVEVAAVAASATVAAEQVRPATTIGGIELAASKGGTKSNMDPALINFKVLYVLTQLCGLTMIVLVGTWIGQHFGGLGGSSNPKLEFNWHPLFMTIGFIYLYGNSILVYRGFRTTRKKTLKLTHAGIHMAAFVLTVIALKTVFDSHNLNSPPIPNLYSLHSWLGLSAVIIFSLQYVAGFVAFLAPGIRENYKIAMMPLHIYFGLFGFVLAIASAVMGLTEKAIFAITSPPYSTLPPAGILANVIGVLYVVFGALVVYLATEPSYRRKPIPEDTALLSSGSANE
ncbi:cytochrome b reductase 1 isoform X2 [Drosophila miranda]|nr:cytochrome b reductase 1 isoform X2 [Drosophila pseudoobscura]XP_015043429.1 cytochrome b reductase 1 isoform X2 [Drosophila pseudoobscura]XP_017135721.1 cytochrome b reductase 1 isoform X2 [Drosophila miranda]XP_017135722.1 cytochrome b reductase 1 isoform X2 [Drosophila miranda]XP_017135723.1 cytochrome b reductase 1 isoform X2 [Drosophila miranda]